MSWRRVVIGIVVLLVVGTAAWWRQAITSDPKLRFTVFNRVNRVEHDATGNQEGIVTKDNAGGSRVEIAFASGQRVFVYLGLRNEGGLGLQIEQVPPAGFYYFGLDTMEVSPERGIGIGQMATYEPFKPFTLKVGEARNVRLTFRMADCTPRNTTVQPGTTSVHGLLMRYKILGVGRTWLVPFEESVLAVPSIGQCERPILDPPPGS